MKFRTKKQQNDLKQQIIFQILQLEINSITLVKKMDAILQQKRKGQAQFRIQIDEYLADSIFTKQQDQLTCDVLQQIFSTSLKQGLYQNNKINTQKLIQLLYENGHHVNIKQMNKILNNKKELKVQQLYQVLKLHDLTQFNLEQEIMKYFFDNDKFSMKKLDKIMKQLGYNELNKKDKQILIQCFDYNRDNSITSVDLQQMMNKAVQNRQNKKNKTKISKTNNQTKNQ